MTGASPGSSGKGCAQGGLRQWAELWIGSQSPPGLAIVAVGPGTSFSTLQNLSFLIYEMGEFTAVSWAADTGLSSVTQSKPPAQEVLNKQTQLQ